MEIIYLYVMEIDDIFIRQSTQTYLYTLWKFMTYLYGKEHWRIYTLWKFMTYLYGKEYWRIYTL
jgi:hypothetical protein